MTCTIQIKGSAAPADKVNPTLMLGYTATRESGSTILRPPGRPAPVVYFHPTRKRSGQLEFLLATEALATSLDALLSRQSVFTLTDTDRAIVGMDFTLDAGGYQIALDDETRGVFTATVQVIEQ